MQADCHSKANSDLEFKEESFGELLNEMDG
jgi:hypothetical protein